MKLKFIYHGEFGNAEYDSSTGEFTWSFDGTDEKILGHLTNLDNGYLFTEIVTGSEVNDGDERSVVGEEIVELPWDEQIEKLEQTFRHYGAHTKLIK